MKSLDMFLFLDEVTSRVENVPLSFLGNYRTCIYGIVFAVETLTYVS